MPLNVTIAHEKKRNARITYSDQVKEVEVAEAGIQADWTDLMAWDRLNKAQAMLEELRLAKLEATKNKTPALWTRV